MHALLRQLLTTAHRRRLFPAPGRAVVAVSGGPDSVALVHALAELAPELGLDLVIAHVDHGLRGEEATADAALVGGIAGRLGLPAAFALRRVVPAPGESLEEAARNVRYDFLAAVARRHEARYMAVGHTADDQAETLLLRLLRGAGPCGLKAMTSPAPRGEASVVRPLLDVPRDLVRAYLNDRGLAFRLDRTNRDLRLARNRTRHVLVPLLASEFNPAIVETLGRTAGLMNEVDEYFSRLAGEILDSDLLVAPGAGRPRPRRASGTAQEPPPPVPPSPPSPPAAVPSAPPWLRIPGPHPACLVLDIRRLNSYDLIIRRYLLRQAILRLQSDLRGIGFDHIDALVTLAGKGGRERRVELPGGMVGLLEGAELSLWTGDPGEARWIPPTPVPLGGRNDLTELGLTIETRLVKLPKAGADKGFNGYPGVEGEHPAGEDPGFAVFDRARLRLPLAIRSRQPGDRIQPHGMTAEKKIKDLLMDARVPRRLRAAVPLFIDGAGEPGERILWVPGCRRSAHALVGADTKEILEVRIFASES
jgi:tRNA(Ile)-lysidine synthase